MKKLFGVLCFFLACGLLVSAVEPEKKKSIKPADVSKKEAAAQPADASKTMKDAKTADKGAGATTPAEPQGTGNIIITRYGAEIPEQPELEPSWGPFIKKAWPFWRENYWIDRGPWPGCNQGVIYRKEEPKAAAAGASTLPVEGMTPVTPGGEVQEQLIPPPPAPPVPTSTADSYTVKKGDCLWFVAGKVYGDPTKWPKIFKANKGKVKNPDRIYPGQVLTIPPKN